MIRVKTVSAVAAAAMMLVVSGCVTTTKVAVEQPGDAKLSCAELSAEFKKLDNVMTEARDNKGVNTANVAAVLLFWPAAVGNYMSADDAEKLVERRRTHLMGIYTQKGC
jgi:hypothetical protein